MKKKFLFYAMRGQKMCFLHVLMNAVDLDKSGYEVKIVFEGEAVTLPPVLADEKNPLYQKCLELGLIAGVCKGCASTLGVLDKIEALDLPLLTDMNGHAGVKPFIEQGYQVAVF
ncbi:MAG: hypothetical protein EOM03_11015 [Clostridia bacterium]|nr:hypothetical protein [Clostridia bacterium]NLF20840.1 hypothetical protein [Clostridiaceae bacterium]